MHRIFLLLSATAIAFAEAAGPGGAPATASATGGGAEAGVATAGGAPTFFPFLMIGGIVVMFYFMAIKPQRQEEKRKKEMLSQTKIGDQIITIGGIHGTVVRVGEQDLDLRLGQEKDGVVVTCEKTAVMTNKTATQVGESSAAGATAEKGKK